MATKRFRLIQDTDSDPRCTNYFVEVDGTMMDMAIDGYIEMNQWVNMAHDWYRVMRWSHNGMTLVGTFGGTMEECREYIDQLLNGAK